MRIKYMGNADVRRVEKGEDFGGRLGVPLDGEIEWNWNNNHVIDTGDHPGADDEFWNLLLDEPDFRDVTGAKRIPTNEAQQMWRAMPKSEDASAVKESASADDTTGSSSGESGESVDSSPPTAPGRRR